MSATRVSAAYEALRRWLRDGGVASGGPIVVKEVAAILRLSPTPVREALERLTGELMVCEGRDRSGFVAPRLSSRDLLELYHLHGILADGAIAIVRHVQFEMLAGDQSADIRETTERFFARLFREAGGATLERAGARVADRLAAHRLLEPEVLAGTINEINLLITAVREGAGRTALRAYHRHRMQRAQQLAQARDDQEGRGSRALQPDIAQI